MKKLKVWYSVREDYARDPEFTVNGMAMNELMLPGMVSRPNGTGDWLLMVFPQATEIMVDGIREFRKGPFFMLWPPSAGHFYGCHDRQWSHSWLHFDGLPVDGIISRSRIPTCSPGCLADLALSERYLWFMHKELSRHYPPDALILRNLFENWMREWSRELGDSAGERRVPLRMLKSKELMEADYDRKLSLKELATAASLSVPHFCHEFRETFGISPGVHLSRIRLSRAQHLLLDENLSISEIAMQVGYGSLFHFSRQFKRHFGVSPRRQRESNRAGSQDVRSL